MFQLSAENAADYLRMRGWVERDEQPQIEPLGWGVSNVVLKVSARRGKLVLKQPHRRLRVKQDWFSRLERIFQEAAAMRVMKRILPPGCVPDVLFEDRENYVLAMSCVPEPHVVWKKELLEGRVSLETGRTIAGHLATLHLQTCMSSSVPSELGDRSMFVELRVEPFYWRMKPVHPELVHVIDAATRSLEEHVVSFVHADYSPKNMLIHSAGVTYVDHETAHYGDPAFDIGFFFSHLALKTVKAAPGSRQAYLELLQTCFAAYKDVLFLGSRGGRRAHRWLLEAPRRAVMHFALCCLARLDGASPVDYLHEEGKRQFVRGTMKEVLLARRPPELDRLFEKLAEAP